MQKMQRAYLKSEAQREHALIICHHEMRQWAKHTRQQILHNLNGGKIEDGVPADVRTAAARGHRGERGAKKLICKCR